MAILFSITGLLLIATVGGMEKADTIPMYGREKRAVRCPKKFAGISGHSACAPKSPRAISKGVTEADKRTIVNEHNKWRQRVSPTASNMLKMEWDNELAMIAQKHADTCQWGHDGQKQRSIPGRFSWVGQNAAMGHANFKIAIKAWRDENKYFTYGSRSSSGKYLHYTQVVWAKTKLVGCGFTTCGRSKYIFCNYGPGGNFNDYSKPYELGPPGSACPSHAKEGLCDCHPCENNAKRDLKTCKCSCASSYYIGKMCENINCTKAKLESNRFCKLYNFPSSCQFSNVRPQCPWQCGICPGERNNGLAFVISSSGILSSQWTIWIPLFLPFTILY